MFLVFFKKWVVGLTVFLLSALLYLPALQNDFVNWDDDLYVYENPAIRNLDLKTVAWMFTSYRTANWHPLTWLSHSVDYALWDLNPFGHHLTSIILHGLNSLLVFLVVLQLLQCVRESPGGAGSGQAREVSAAGIAALLFGFHPLHVESVAWISERKDLLCAFFVLLSMWAYITYAAAPAGGRKRLGFAACLVFAALALMAKPMAVSLPLILLLIDVYPLRRLGGEAGGTSQLLFEKIPFVGMSAASGLVTLRAQQVMNAIGSFDIISLQARLLNGMHAVVFYLQKMLVPIGLSPLYPYPHPSTIRWSDTRYLISIMVIVLITAGCVWLSRRGKHLWSASWAYYVITLLPVLGLVQVGMQAAADRYTYLPGISIFLLAGVGMTWAWNRAALVRYALFRKGVILTVLCLVFSLMGMLTVKQIGVWRTPEHFWNYVIAHTPVKIPVAYNNLGNALIRAGNLEEAISTYKQALAAKPDYADARYNLGIAYTRSGDVDEAITQYKKLLAYAPGYARAHYHLGNAYRDKGLIDAAVAEYEKALSIDSGDERARRNLMDAKARQGAQDQKIHAYEKALTANPGDATLHNNLGDLYVKKGMMQKAIVHLKQAIALKPDYAEAYNYLAWIYATSIHDQYRDGREAIQLAAKACELTEYGNANFLDTLAAAFAEAGDFKSAVRYQEKAISMSPENEQPSLRIRLLRYQSGQAHKSY